MDRIQGVLCDVDGTLIDSNEAHAQAYSQAFTEAGYNIPYAQIVERIGMGGDKLLPAVIGIEKDSAQGKSILARRAEIYKSQYLPHLRAFPDAHALLERMRAAGIKLLIVTSGEEDEVHAALKQTGLEDLFEAHTSSKDASNSKPDPDIVQTALDRANLTGADTLMLGDTPYDIEAAAKAGVGTIALRSGGHDDHALAAAIAIYNDVQDLLMHYEASPFYSPHSF